MKRKWLIWFSYAVSFVLVLAVMTWLSQTAIHLEEMGRQARIEKAFEENIRLALWRMDSALTPLISRENARPFESYEAMYEEERTLLREQPFKLAGEGAQTDAPLVLLHFGFDPKGKLNSALMPKKQLLNDDSVPNEVKIAAQRLSLLKKMTAKKEFFASVQYLKAGEKSVYQVAETTPWFPHSKKNLKKNANIIGPKPIATNNLSGSTESNNVSSNNPSTVKKTVSGKAKRYRMRQAPPEEMKQELMQPIWVEDTLFLVRRIQRGEHEYFQGCWLNWPALRQMLLELTSDLLPNAELIPLENLADKNDSDLLAAIPVRLAPGTAPNEVEREMTPLKISLGIAWIGVFLAALAIGFVLHSSMVHSERRAAFTNAVTHELRTPLTTFRMYTEMLDERMITDPEKAQSYLSTLHREADRLSHLVENVLTYSRLERGRKSPVSSPIQLGEMIDRMHFALNERITQTEMVLETEIDKETGKTIVSADPAAVERIIYNLVDNAAKYAASAVDRRVVLQARVNGKFAELSVRDFGPGLANDARKRLFKAFSKSSEDAAHSAPGVGLGLAISKSLAHQMGGDLMFEKQTNPGVQFTLKLPLAH